VNVPPVAFGLMVTVCRLLMPVLTVAPSRTVLTCTSAEASGLGTRPVEAKVSAQAISSKLMPA